MSKPKIDPKPSKLLPRPDYTKDVRQNKTDLDKLRRSMTNRPKDPAEYRADVLE